MDFAYPPEPAELQDRARTVARRNAAGDGWIVDGEKWFVTVGDAADFLITLAMAHGRPTLFLIGKATPGVLVKRLAIANELIKRGPATLLRLPRRP